MDINNLVPYNVDFNKLRSTNPFITFNTNYRPKPNDDVPQAALFEALERVLTDHMTIKRFVDILNPEDTYDNNVYQCLSTFSVQRGPITGFLHCHINMELIHTTKVRINFWHMKTEINEVFTMLQNKCRLVAFQYRLMQSPLAIQIYMIKGELKGEVFREVKAGKKSKTVSAANPILQKKTVQVEVPEFIRPEAKATFNKCLNDCVNNCAKKLGY